MKKITEELAKIARELKKEHDALITEVREGGHEQNEGLEKANKGFKRVIAAVHKLHNHIEVIPEKLNRVVRRLQTLGGNGR